VDRGVEVAVEDLLVERADERAGFAEAVDQLVADLIARGVDLGERHLPAARGERGLDRRCLSPCEIRAARGEAHGRGL
jgi:hypothetical protein